MLKSILKKSFADISTSFMIILICFILASFFPSIMKYTSAQRLFFYDLLFKVVLGLCIIATLGIISHHFIMNPNLFNIKKPVRQGISLFIVASLSITVNLFVFSIIPKTYVFIGIVLIAMLAIGGMTVGFVIEDKLRKKDVEIINKRLNELKDEQ